MLGTNGRTPATDITQSFLLDSASQTAGRAGGDPFHGSPPVAKKNVVTRLHFS